MQDVFDNKVIGIVQNNSIDYLDSVFQFLVNQNQFVPLRSKSFCQKIDYLHFDSVLIPGNKTGWYSPKFNLPHNNDIAQISFTSGTEGEPKGILLTHNQLGDTVSRLLEVMQISSEIKEYIGVPVYHSFGYGRIRVCNQVGGKAFIPSTGFNPQEIATMLANDEINSISAVPTQWRLLFQQQGLFEKTGKRIKWIEIGSQFMSEEEKESLRLIFPNALIVQHYGLTEASRSTFLTISDGINLSSVGKPTADCELRISSDGLIEVKGSHVANYQITSLGLKKITNQSGWFTTSDQGAIEDGYLSFLGRSDDIINIGGLKVSPDDLERSLHVQIGTNVSFAISKIKDNIRGETILLTLLPKHLPDLDNIQKQLHIILDNMGLNLGSQVSYQTIPELPVTDTGKIQRKKLSANYESSQQSTVALDPNAKMSEKVKHHLKLEEIEDFDSFLSLDGDSLLLVILSLEVEKHVGYLPDNWQALTFEQLDNLKSKKDSHSKIKLSATIWVIAFVICFLILGELALQTRSYLKTGRSAFNLLNNESTVVKNPTLGIKTYRPNLQVKDVKTNQIKYDINNLGLRSPNISLIPSENELRIAIVGASSVAGVYAKNNNNTFPALLEAQLLSNSDDTINVINGGIQGANLKAITVLTDKIISPLKPNYIVVYTGLNDLAQVCRTKTENTTTKSRALFNVPRPPSWLMTADMLQKNTVFLRTSPRNKNAYLDVNTMDTSWFKSGIEKLVQTIKLSGATPVLMTNARSYINVEPNQVEKLAEGSLYFYTCLDLAGVIKAGKVFNDIIRESSVRNNIPLIDLASKMPGGNDYFVDGGHFTLKGEKFVANQLADFVESTE